MSNLRKRKSSLGTASAPKSMSKSKSVSKSTTTSCTKVKKKRVPRIHLTVQQAHNLPRRRSPVSPHFLSPVNAVDPIVIVATTVPDDGATHANIVWTVDGMVTAAAGPANTVNVAGTAAHHFTVTGALDGDTDTVHIWVFRVVLAVLDHGNIPADCTKDFSNNAGGNVTDHPGTLGAIIGTNHLTQLDQGQGRVCVEGTLQPPGVNAVVGGLRITRTIVEEKTWTDGGNLQHPVNADDTTNAGHMKQWGPDPNHHHIYDLDAPSIALFDNVNTESSVETYMHFQQEVTYYGTPCSNTVDWHFIGEYLTGTPAAALQAHPVAPPQVVAMDRGNVPNVSRVVVAAGALNVGAIAAPRYTHLVNGALPHITLSNAGERP